MHLPSDNLQHLWGFGAHGKSHFERYRISKNHSRLDRLNIVDFRFFRVFKAATPVGNLKRSQSYKVNHIPSMFILIIKIQQCSLKRKLRNLTFRCLKDASLCLFQKKSFLLNGKCAFNTLSSNLTALIARNGTTIPAMTIARSAEATTTPILT